MKLFSQKNYTLVSGILLFLLGFLGFAFHPYVNLGTGYLLGALILGFWGIITFFGTPKSPN